MKILPLLKIQAFSKLISLFIILNLECLKLQNTLKMLEYHSSIHLSGIANALGLIRTKVFFSNYDWPDEIVIIPRVKHT